MSYPNLTGKHAFEPFVSPADYLRYLRETYGWEGLPPLVGVILTFQASFFRQVVASGGWAKLESPRSALGELHVLSTDRGAIGISGAFGVGAPAATNRLEDIAAAGPRRFIAIGFAGGLQPHLRTGDLVVCDRAIRDEGVSHHYLPPGRYSTPSPQLTARLSQHLAKGPGTVAVGTSWTIDTPYRETVKELRQYRAEGVLTVEMEAAALAAVSECRGLEFATAFTVSDSLTELTWDPEFHRDDVLTGLDRLLEASVAALLEE